MPASASPSPVEDALPTKLYGLVSNAEINYQHRAYQSEQIFIPYSSFLGMRRSKDIALLEIHPLDSCVYKSSNALLRGLHLHTTVDGFDTIQQRALLAENHGEESFCEKKSRSGGTTG